MGPLGKCAPCLDQALSAADGNGAGPASDAQLAGRVPDAVVSVTVMMPFSMNGQQVMAPSQMGVCLAHRRAQLGTVSKSGLIRG